ncbi:uncharacterized protein BDW43DRAFT_271406 [Aspergillus alliaceus]|uniref:uncharacterized protein n=1 Tax=Petromyces alliaceus TaxID=209559 RepID=UPI0012A4E4C0|nr:uncharacterized protein BDW43DRAFT_271406 [Aspergillus alliaceus]KAB8235254.1 hypothetical protein BDW43DRAFT_271406 [Aspergillus alliaceus]
MSSMFVTRSNPGDTRSRIVSAQTISDILDIHGNDSELESQAVREPQLPVQLHPTVPDLDR